MIFQRLMTFFNDSFRLSDRLKVSDKKKESTGILAVTYPVDSSFFQTITTNKYHSGLDIHSHRDTNH